MGGRLGIGDGNLYARSGRSCAARRDSTHAERSTPLGTTRASVDGDGEGEGEGERGGGFRSPLCGSSLRPAGQSSVRRAMRAI